MTQEPDQYAPPQDDFNQRSLELLLADVELALTFTDVARTLSGKGAIAQTVRNARHAYDVISAKRTNLAIAEGDFLDLDSKLTLLRHRLEEIGEKFE